MDVQRAIDLNTPSNDSLAKLLKSLGILMLKKNIQFPNHVTKIKIDVGLSKDAPQAFQWLESDPNVGVIGIEPLDFNVAAVQERISSHPESQSILPRFHILPIALGLKIENKTIYVTAGDAGSSSLFRPLSLPVLREETVRVFRLDEVLGLIDEKRFPVIHFLKLDCQGSDLEILKSGPGLLRRVAVVTAEAEDTSYLGTSNSEEDMDTFMTSQGFIRHNPRSPLRRRIGAYLAPILLVQNIYGALKKLFARFSIREDHAPLQVEDPTFVNQLFARSVYSGEITAWQKG